jgi:hypothetical protein
VGRGAACGAVCMLRECVCVCVCVCVCTCVCVFMHAGPATPAPAPPAVPSTTTPKNPTRKRADTAASLGHSVGSGGAADLRTRYRRLRPDEDPGGDQATFNIVVMEASACACACARVLVRVRVRVRVFRVKGLGVRGFVVRGLDPLALRFGAYTQGLGPPSLP